MLYIISVDSMDANITRGGYMFSVRGVRDQKGSTIVDSFCVNLHEQYTVK